MTKPALKTKKMKWSRQMLSFLGLRRSMVAMLTMVILVGMGEHMAERFLPLYLIALGGGALSVGFLNGMDNLLERPVLLPGRLPER